MTIWRRIKAEVAISRVGAIPGIAVIGAVMIVKFAGLMQSVEWLALDSLLRVRPAEAKDERILIVGINEEDIKNLKAYPVPDREISGLLKILQTYQPRVIGLDIYRNLPVEPGHVELVTTLKDNKNLIVIEKAIPHKVDPPPGLAPERVGFADQVTDMDGKLRRTLLSIPTGNGDSKFSLTLLLAEKYLAAEGLKLENGKGDPATMMFGKSELPRFLSNYGGYVRTDDGGVQVLLNFRSGQERFRTITLGDLKTGKFQPGWIRDRIVIIGITAPSVKDFITTSAIPSAKPATGRVYGVEIQAHAVSQIISTVLDGRSMLKSWSGGWEYLWILGWGLLGISFARLTKSPSISLFAVAFASTCLFLISYLLLILGWWVPFTPAMLVLTLNGIGLTALYQYDRALRSGINARQTIIESTFETIHNGPLQTLAKLLKRVRDRDLPAEELLPEIEKELDKLNHELRGIYEFLQREPINQGSNLYLGNGLVLNLKDPVHEILYQVYNHTLGRDFPCFKSLKVKVVKFDPQGDRDLSSEQKQGLCRFLEEALCNVGRHATGVHRLEVSYSADEGWYTLSVVDDGLGINSPEEGRGTKQFRNLAKQLKGKFRRSPLSPRGTLCELSWPVSKFGLR
jgi:CHASE2 domain-containing sensor protein